MRFPAAGQGFVAVVPVLEQEPPAIELCEQRCRIPPGLDAVFHRAHIGLPLVFVDGAERRRRRAPRAVQGASSGNQSGPSHQCSRWASAAASVALPLPRLARKSPTHCASSSSAAAANAVVTVNRRFCAMPRCSHRGRRPKRGVAILSRTGPARELMAPDDQPRNLKTMLSEAKDTSELMVDLAYAALFFGDARMANEVEALEERLEDLAHAMREVCVLAARSPRDAEEMSSVLHVLSAIERMGNAGVDIAHIVTHRLGIPPALVADLAAAEEISHRVRVTARQRTRAAIARRCAVTDRSRDACGRDPARQRLALRPRRRRDVAARRRPDPPWTRGRHRRAS